MKVIKSGTISATTTVSLGTTIEPENYIINLSTNGYYKYAYEGAPSSAWGYGYGIGAWWTNKTSTQVTINVSSGITCSYEIIQLA